MSELHFGLAVGGLVLLAAMTAGAQGPKQAAGSRAEQGLGQGAGRGAEMPERGQGAGQYQGDMFTLVANPAVQNELKLDPQQQEELRALGQSNEIRVRVRGVRAQQNERISKTLEISRPQQKQIDQLLSGGFRGRAADGPRASHKMADAEARPRSCQAT